MAVENLESRIGKIAEFITKLNDWEKSPSPELRSWLNQNMHSIRRETLEARTHINMTIYPPPAVGGLVMHIDPFDHMFDRPYLMSLVPHITDMLEKTIGVLRNPSSETPSSSVPRMESEIQKGYAFVAMPIDRDDHQLVDVLEAIKAGAKECGVTAERVDDDERNERITDRILESINKAEFVIVDLTNQRPNVFWEAGYAQGIGKTPIYIARDGTTIHFDVKDYPVIIFRNMKELREGIAKRLHAVAKRRTKSAG
jgi:hypothetical protein